MGQFPNNDKSGGFYDNFIPIAISMDISNEPVLTSTDQVILTRLTRMAGVSDELRAKIFTFREFFINSTKRIIDQRKILEDKILKYKEKSKNSTVHKAKIQLLQISLETVLQKIENLKYNEAEALSLQDQIDEQQRIHENLSHGLDDAKTQKERAEITRKNKMADIEEVLNQQKNISDRLERQWEKHSKLTRKLGDEESRSQQLKDTNEKIQKHLTEMESNAEKKRREMNDKESNIYETINQLQKEVSLVDRQINEMNGEFQAAIESYKQQTLKLNDEREKIDLKNKKLVKEIGQLRSEEEGTFEEIQKIEKLSVIAKEELEKEEKIAAEKMSELAQRMSLPETQTKEISSLELENRELKRRVDELIKQWQASTDEVEEYADKISRSKIAKYDPAAQEAAIKERILRDSAIRVQEIVDSAMSMLSCTFCGKTLEDPVTFVPCGHCVCHSHRFHLMENPICPKCQERAARAYVDHSLSVVLSKFIYIKDVLSNLDK